MQGKPLCPALPKVGSQAVGRNNPNKLQKIFYNTVFFGVSILKLSPVL